MDLREFGSKTPKETLFKVEYTELKIENLIFFFKAEVWPGPTYFPDFTDLEFTGQWWTEECKKFYDLGVTYNALWIDMNEPANFQTDSGALVVSFCI